MKFPKYYRFLSVFMVAWILSSAFFVCHVNAVEVDQVFLGRDVESLDIIENNESKKVDEIPHFSFKELYNDDKNDVVSIFVDPNNISINAVSVKLKYSKDDLKPVIIDNTNSNFSLFFVENIDEVNGIVTITYIEPYPGLSKKSLVADILFEKLNNKESVIYIEDGSEVLANDGLGTHLLWKSEKLSIK